MIPRGLYDARGCQLTTGTHEMTTRDELQLHLEKVEATFDAGRPMTTGAHEMTTIAGAYAGGGFRGFR